MSAAPDFTPTYRRRQLRPIRDGVPLLIFTSRENPILAELRWQFNCGTFDRSELPDIADDWLGRGVIENELRVQFGDLLLEDHVLHAERVLARCRDALA